MQYLQARYMHSKQYVVHNAHVVASTVTFEISIMTLNTLVLYNIVSEFSCVTYFTRLKIENLL